MLKEISLGGTKIQYDLQYKKVKNINLRIKPDGSVTVSASRFVSQRVIDSFLCSKAEFIVKAIKKYESVKNLAPVQYFSREEIQSVILDMCLKIYPLYEAMGIKYPKIKFKKMTSRWGSCNPSKGTLNFNINLMYVPKEGIEYVVYHEFTHFLQANHSKKFYDELSKVCPHWKKYRMMLKEIPIGKDVM